MSDLAFNVAGIAIALGRHLPQLEETNLFREQTPVPPFYLAAVVTDAAEILLNFGDPPADLTREDLWECVANSILQALTHDGPTSFDRQIHHDLTVLFNG